MNPHGDRLQNVWIWMQLLGFRRDDEDRGAKRVLETIGYRPENIVLLLYHPDFAQLHRGMAEEVALFPDNAAYGAIPGNAERSREPWTNHDLRALVRSLHAESVGVYAGLMAPVNDNRFHDEWVSSHPEVRYEDARPRHVLNLLKRFSDGTYYEDFFIAKVKETLVDYELDGIQIADMFLTQIGTRSRGDFSSDMVRQFLEATDEPAPESVIESLDETTERAYETRRTWLWSKPMRRKWLHFYAGRWESFMRKLTGELHSAGKKVLVLAQYCTDPVETYHCLGVDMKRLMRAGVDAFCSNPLPTSVYMDSKLPESRFHELMSIIPLTAAYLPGAKLYPMLNVQDATEEWSVIQHDPVRFERDLFTEQAFRVVTKHGAIPAAHGALLCLGDGLPAEEWTRIRRLYDAVLSDRDDEAISPTLLWSDEAMERFLDEYPETLRPSVHREATELMKRGTMIGAVVRSEDLAYASGPLLVFGFDLLSKEEQEAVIRYRGPVVATASPGFSPESCGFQPSFCISDTGSPYGETAFGRGVSLPEDAAQLMADESGVDVLPEDAVDPENVVLSTLPCRKVSGGFYRVLAAALNRCGTPFSSDCPMIALRRSDGSYRLYLYNPDPNHYTVVTVRAKERIADASVKSSFPWLPPRFERDGAFTFDGAPSYAFQLKLAPDGVSVAEVRMKS